MRQGIAGEARIRRRWHKVVIIERTGKYARVLCDNKAYTVPITEVRHG